MGIKRRDVSTVPTAPKPRNLSKIKERGGVLLKQRFAMAMREPENIPLKELLQVYRGDIGSGYQPTLRKFHEPHDFAKQQKRSVHNSASAITAYCARCQCATNHEEAKQLVRDCDMLDCPLWAFRLGGDPFFNKRG